MEDFKNTLFLKSGMTKSFRDRERERETAQLESTTTEYLEAGEKIGK